MADYEPKNVLIGVGVLKVDGTSVGYTSGGVTLVATADRIDKEVDQSYAPIGVHKVRESFELRTNLAETTLENLKLVWEQSKAIVVDVPGKTRTLPWGMNQSVIAHSLEFRGRSPDGLDRKFLVHKAVVWEVGEVVHQKDALTVIPITFRILPDTAQPEGEEYGSIVDFTP
jgi:hypothetical protein